MTATALCSCGDDELRAQSVDARLYANEVGITTSRKQGARWSGPVVLIVQCLATLVEAEDFAAAILKGLVVVVIVVGASEVIITGCHNHVVVE